MVFFFMVIFIPWDPNPQKKHQQNKQIQVLEDNFFSAPQDQGNPSYPPPKLPPPPRNKALLRETNG